MSAATRALSTGFQVMPSTFRLDPTIAPSAYCSSSAALATLNPVLTRTGTPLPAIALVTSASAEASAAWLVIGPETQMASGVEEKTTDLATSAIGRGAIGRGELGVDVEDHLDVLRANLAAITPGIPSGADPEAKVAGERAGEDLPTECGSGCGRDRQRGVRIPEHVDAKGHRELVAKRRDDIGDGGDRGEVGIEGIGAVVLVAEHDRVDPASLERIEIALHPVANAGHAGRFVVERRSREGRQMDHADDRFLLARQLAATSSRPPLVLLMLRSSAGQPAAAIVWGG